MTKSATTEAVDTVERLVRILPEKNRARLQKERQGLKARLNWTHITAEGKALIESRIAAIETDLGSGE